MLNKLDTLSPWRIQARNMIPHFTFDFYLHVCPSVSFLVHHGLCLGFICFMSKC
uniref:Uncharacterized protein n=1 Tax=Rhizophora mucronata TaxID=61149 RepID=A0A2P2IZ27_RHIMU